MDKRSKHLILFLAATFLWTWAFYAPIAIGHHSTGQMPYPLLLIFGGMGPSVVGVGMVLLTNSKEQRRDYFHRCFSCSRIRPAWWAVIFLVPAAIITLAIALNLGMGGDLPGFTLLQSLLANPLSLPLTAFLSFMSGPWSEEFGWRGYALERIIRRLGAFRGTLALGFLWAIWHFPLYFMSGTWHGEMGFRLAGFWSFIAYSLGLSLIMTTVFLKNHASILSGMLLHFTANFAAQLTVPASDSFEIIRALVMLAAGVAFYLVWVNPKQAALPKPKIAAHPSDASGTIV